MTRSSKPMIKKKKVTPSSSCDDYDLLSLKQTVLELVPPTIAGTVVFASTLALSTLTQLKIFGISTGTMAPIPSMAGVLSVAAASIASQTVSIQAYQKWKNINHSKIKLPSVPPMSTLWQTFPEYYKKNDLAQDIKMKAQTMGINMKAKAFEIGNDVKVKANEISVVDLPFSIGNNLKDTVDATSVSHAIRVCVVGMLLFKGLGGRFWSISPSSFTNLGSFARVSLPATDAYATEAQRSMIETLGRRFGCHTCGSHMFFRSSPVSFHADHMPPRSVAKQMNSRWYRKLLRLAPIKQRFYPQCVTCSNKQGKLLGTATNRIRDAMNKGIKLKTKTSLNLAKAGGGKKAHFHGFRPRISHLSGGLIAAITIFDTNQTDVMGGNKQRFLEMQNTVESAYDTVRSWIQ